MPAPDDTTAPPTAPAASRAGWAVSAVEWLALGLMIAAGLAAWRAGVGSAGYDYDEVTRAHSTWLASRGLRPYQDFFEVHPPYFRLIAPVVRDWSDPMPTLRWFAAVGNALFLAGLAAVASALVGREARRWAILGVAAVAFQPAVLAYLVEFRIDGWGYAPAAWALFLYLKRRPSPYRDFELGALTGVATLFFCPKLTILPALVVACGQVGPGWSVGRAARSVGAYAAGVGAALGLFLAFLSLQGIEWGRMAQLLVRYHSISVANGSLRRGLLRAIGQNRILLGLVGTGALAWGVAVARRRERPGAYRVALLAWLAAQAAAVAYPYKQYFAPWFLFASGYVGSIGPGASSPGWVRPVRTLAFVALCGFTAYSASAIAQLWGRFDEASGQRAIMRWMDAVAEPADRVVASAPHHPVDRRDAFFLWFNTGDPSGFDSEQILARLPSYAADVAPGRFLAELEANPPALVLLAGPRMVPFREAYSAGQRRALAEFLPRRGYQSIQLGPLRCAVRPDRVDRAGRAAPPR